MIETAIYWIIGLAGLVGASAYFLVNGLEHLVEVRDAWRKFRGR